MVLALRIKHSLSVRQIRDASIHHLCISKSSILIRAMKTFLFCIYIFHFLLATLMCLQKRNKMHSLNIAHTSCHTLAERFDYFALSHFFFSSQRTQWRIENILLFHLQKRITIKLPTKELTDSVLNGNSHKIYTKKAKHDFSFSIVNLRKNI